MRCVSYVDHTPVRQQRLVGDVKQTTDVRNTDEGHPNSDRDLFQERMTIRVNVSRTSFATNKDG